MRQPTRRNNVLDLVLTTEANSAIDLSVDESVGGRNNKLIRFSMSLSVT